MHILPIGFVEYLMHHLFSFPPTTVAKKYNICHYACVITSHCNLLIYQSGEKMTAV